MFPLVKGTQAVGSHHQLELSGRVFLLQVSKGINGIGGPGQPELNIGGPEPVVVLHGQLHQSEPVVVPEEGFFLFQGILRTYHEPELLQIAVFDHVIRNGHMTDVNGIKRSKVESGSHKARKSSMIFSASFRACSRVVSSDGKSEKLPAITAGQPSVLLIYRGGWCPFCNRHLSDIETVQDKVLDLGYQIIAISPDSPGKLNVTIDEDQLKYGLYSDGTGELIKALGLAFKAPERSLGRLLEYSEGQNTGFLPVPAVFVTNGDGNIVFEYVNPDYKVRLSGKMLVAVLENL